MNVLIVVLDAASPAVVPDAEVLVVAPALNSWLRHWISDEDDARHRAEERAAAFVDRLKQDGVHAEGRVGDADPLLAIADALPTFPADEILIAVQPESSSRLADELVSRARERFALPIARAWRVAPTGGVARDREAANTTALPSARLQPAGTGPA